MQHEDAENIGYVIPNPVIEHFLTDFDKHGKYTAFPSLGIEWQKLDSPYLRTFLKMKVRSIRNFLPCPLYGLVRVRVVCVRYPYAASTITLIRLHGLKPRLLPALPLPGPTCCLKYFWLSSQ